MGDTTEQLEPDELSASAEAITAAKKVLASIQNAVKNFALYPETHASTQRLLTAVKSSFDEFFAIQKDLRLTIEQDRLLLGGQEIHHDPENTEGLAFLFFRDGLKWFEFQDGLEIQELITFFSLLNQYRSLQAESDGDLVTAFYGADFSHIAYEASEDFFEGEPLLDLSQLNVNAAHGGDFLDEEKTEDDKDRSDDSTYISIADPSINRNLWQITEEESAILNHMVDKENKGLGPADVFEVLLVILKSQADEEDFAVTLDFILEELLDGLARQQFLSIHNLLKSLTEMYRKHRDNPWLPGLVKAFFHKLSSPPVLDTVIDSIKQLDDQNQLLMQQARSVFLFLASSAMESLGEALPDMKSPAQQRLLLEIIGIMAQRNFTAYEELIVGAEGDRLVKLLTILKYIKGKRAEEILLDKIYHPSPLVRQTAIKILLGRDARIINKLFPLIDDPNESVRQTIIYGIGQHKSDLSESLLLNYMEQKPFKKGSGAHVTACFKALGGCGGSARSLAFLKKVLLDQGWNSILGLGKPLFRQNAAIALLLIDSGEAKNILTQAAQSSSAIIRNALQKAIETKNNGQT
jgi:hypothetical protein